VGPGVGVGAAALLWGGLVLEPAPLLVVRPERGPGPLAGRAGAVLRRRRRGAWGGAPGQHGGAGRTRASPAGAAPASAGVRRRPRVHVRRLLPRGMRPRKGKVERPFRELKEALFGELVLASPGSIGELNTRAARWLATVVHPRPHRVTGEPPAARLLREQPLLAPLPRVRYDTARREPRVVPRVPLVPVRRQLVLGPARAHPPGGRGPPAGRRDRAGGLGRWRSRHRPAPARAGRQPAGVDPSHKQAAEQLALRRHQRPARHLEPVDPPPPPCLADLDLGPGDYQVAIPDLAARYDLDTGATP
jgi:hypothetical protein